MVPEDRGGATLLCVNTQALATKTCLTYLAVMLKIGHKTSRLEPFQSSKFGYIDNDRLAWFTLNNERNNAVVAGWRILMDAGGAIDSDTHMDRP